VKGSPHRIPPSGMGCLKSCQWSLSVSLGGGGIYRDKKDGVDAMRESVQGAEDSRN